jgi:hypothetical protein
MKLILNLVLGFVGLTNVAVILSAADSTTPYITYTTNTPGLLNYSTSSSIAVTSSNSVRLALNAQSLLLNELIREHEKRASELVQKNQSEKAKWEAELVNELQEKNARMQKNIELATQPGSAPNGLKAGSAEVDDQLAFVSTVEAGLEQVRQDLSRAMEEASVLSVQIATNKAPEDFAGMSAVLSQNQRLVKQLQKEQLDLELRKLEFRAIQKLLQK